MKGWAWLIILILGIFVLVVTLPSMLYTGRYGGSHGMMGGWHMMGFGGVFMWLIIILVVGLVIYFLLRETGSEKEKTGDEAMEILKKRYARGEITKEEFEEMKKQLRES